MPITIWKIEDAPVHLQRLLWSDKGMGNNPEEREEMRWVATEPKESDRFWGREDAAHHESLALVFGAGVKFYTVELETETVYFFTSNNTEDEMTAIFS